MRIINQSTADPGEKGAFTVRREGREGGEDGEGVRV